jgi:glycosyltransferase involved in cell wall biosynthesis
MVPASQPTHRMKRNMSERQIQRRKSKYNENAPVKVDDPNISDSKFSLLYKFGKSSRVLKGDGRYIFDVSEKDIEDFDAVKFSSMLTSVHNPIFKAFETAAVNSGIPSYPIRPAKPFMLHFGIWMNNVKHYSGGRIHTLLAAHHLAEMGHKVTIVTDMYPETILEDFKFFDVEDRIEFVAGDICFKSNWLLKNEYNNMNIVIVIPRIMEGFSYAMKWNLPCYATLFESPNFVSAHRGGYDGTEEYWREYKLCLNNYATHILSNPGPTLEAVQNWLKGGKFDGNYFEFPPPINTYMADRITAIEENEIAFVGRHLDFKCPDDVIKAVGKLPKKLKPKVNFIGSHNDTVRRRLQDCAGNRGVEIEFFAGIDDAQKFYLLKRSKLLVIPSRFEGFGMPPAEAIYCGKPVIAYDLDITRWIYGDTVSFVKPGNIKELSKYIENYLVDDKEREETTEVALRKMWSPKSNIPCLPHKVKNNYRRIFYGKQYPKITAGIIILNGVDVIKNTLDSIYDSVEKIILVEGAVEAFAENNPDLVVKGHSIDGTIDYLKNGYFDPLNKLEIMTIEKVFPDRKNKLWKNKNEMQNAIAERIKTEIYLKVDSDEVWKESDIEYIRRIFMAKPDLTVVKMQRWHFWKNLDTIAVGGQWDSTSSRAWRWNEDFRHPMEDRKGFNYYRDKDGRNVAEPFYKVMKLMTRMHYHLGYCRNDEQVISKIRYYANRGIEENVRDRYTDWKQGQPTSSTHPSGTHATKFIGTLPKVLDKKRFPDVVKVEVSTSTENNVSMLSSPNK